MAISIEMSTTDNGYVNRILAVYLLIGLPPAKAMLDIRTLSLFRSVVAADVATPSTIFRELISRQLVMKDNSAGVGGVHQYLGNTGMCLLKDPPL